MIGGRKQVVYDIVRFEDIVRNTLIDIDAGRENFIVLIPQEPLLGISSLQICKPPDNIYLLAEFIQSPAVKNEPGTVQNFYGDSLTITDALSICTELFLKIDPRKDGC